MGDAERAMSLRDMATRADEGPDGTWSHAQRRTFALIQTRIVARLLALLCGLSVAIAVSTPARAVVLTKKLGWYAANETETLYRTAEDACKGYTAGAYIQRLYPGATYVRTYTYPSTGSAACYIKVGASLEFNYFATALVRETSEFLPSCPVSNPVEPSSGMKLHTESDYLGSGADALSLVRSYRSIEPQGISERVAPGWAHQYARSVTTVDAGAWAAYVQRGDLSLLQYNFDGTRWVATGLTDKNTLTRLQDAAGATTGWRYMVFDDDSEETYSASGALQSVRQRNGWTTTLRYSDTSTPVAEYLEGATAPQAGRLIAAKNHFGRELRFVYDASGHLVQLLVPGAVAGTGPGNASSPIRYAYAEAASLGSGVRPSGQLTGVTWQDGSVRRYHYEDTRYPAALTGITDEAGIRYATYAYDEHGRATRSEHVGGADRVDFQYGATIDGIPTTTVTDYTGANGSATTRTYRFGTIGSTRVNMGVSAPCSTCGVTAQGITYNANGSKLKEIAHEGAVTFYQYDAKNRETERASFPSGYQTATARPALSAASKVVSSKWHATWNLPTQIAEPSKITAYTYSTKGNLTGESWTATTDATGAAKFSAVKTGSTYATGWGYNSSSLNTSVVEKTDATETGRWTLAYNAVGDVISVKDVKRAVTATMSSYDASGHMLTGKTDAAVTIGFAYAPRGFVSRKTVNGQAIVFTQNALGLTTEVRTPDGQTLNYVYDPTHRLTDVKLNGASITPAMLAAADYPDTFAKAKVEQLRALLKEFAEGLIPPAFAQAGAVGRLPVVIVPGAGMPGQPQFDPRTDMLMVPMSPADKAYRTLMEQMLRACQCDPSGGYSKPTLTAASYAHLLWGGHLGPMFSDQSYFTVPVNQALVDEVVALSTLPGATVVTRGQRKEYSVPMGRAIGMTRLAGNSFATTSRIKMVVEDNNCAGTRARNEIVTMHPD